LNAQTQIGDQWRIARAEQVRSAMGPDLCAVADALRETFGAKVVWLSTEKLTLGVEPEDVMPTSFRSERRYG
jgi:hypothetical protein